MLIDTKQAIDFLNKGQVVAIPTETVYGLAGLGNSESAILNIYALKNRPAYNPLIMHIDTLDKVKNCVKISKNMEKIIQSFWFDNKHPLSIVLPITKEAKFCKIALANQQSVAIRMPHHPIAIEILKNTKYALAAPSANKSNSISPTSAKLVEKSLSNINIVDGGICDIGIESSIIGEIDNKIIIYRHGFVTKEMLLNFADVVETKQINANNIQPGSLSKHYAPSKKLFINVKKKIPNMGLIGFGDVENCDLNLSKSANLAEAAHNLFNFLNILDDSSFSCIGITPIPNEGVGIAINDKIKRASF